MSLAQIGEFAFVLLSRASNLHLVEVIHYFDALFMAHYDLIDYFLVLEND